MNRIKYFLLILSLSYLVAGIGLCILLFLFNIKSDITDSTIIALLGVIIFSGLLSLTYFYLKLKDKISYPGPSCLFVMAICTLIVTFGITELLFYRIPVSHHLKIKVSGKKNTSSLGKEVWIIGRRNNFNQIIDIDVLQCSPGWQIKEGDMVSTGRSNDTCSWSGEFHTGLKIAFLKHEFSGIVDVVWDDISSRYDLYSSSPEYEPVTLPRYQNNSAWLFFKVTFGIGLGTFLGLSGLWFLAKPLDEQDNH